MISLIHPSRSRPELAFKTASSWIQNAGCEIKYLLSLDYDDVKSSEYRIDLLSDLMDSESFDKGKACNFSTCFAENKSAIEAINNAAKMSNGDILIQISDDFQCFPNWAKTIEDLMKGKSDWILKTQDGIQPWIITLPIMDREYYNRFGYIYHPSYKHAWSDTEMTCVAELTERKVESQLLFRHLNDGETKIKDALQERNDSTFEEGKKLFIERKRISFDLPLKDLHGRMTPNFYTTLQ